MWLILCFFLLKGWTVFLSFTIAKDNYFNSSPIVSALNQATFQELRVLFCVINAYKTDTFGKINIQAVGLGYRVTGVSLTPERLKKYRKSNIQKKFVKIYVKLHLNKSQHFICNQVQNVRWTNNDLTMSPVLQLCYVGMVL